jgi:3-deoxy-D-manno-octulosonic-acid transferase
MSGMDRVGAAGKVLLSLLGASWRFDYRRPPSGRAGRRRGHPVLFSFWHGLQLPLIYTYRNEGVTVLVSRHRDGEYVARILEAMGFHTVRGSTTRGGAEAMRELAGLLMHGADCAISPDGPKGPAGRARPGFAHISRLSRRAVVPMAVSAWPRIRLRSWDRFMLALPFARMVVVEGRPLKPPSRSDDPAEATSTLENAMRASTAYADFLAMPSSRLFSGLASFAGSLLSVPASVALAARPAREREERRGRIQPTRTSPVIMHGSSLGEVSGLLPLAAVLRDEGVPVHLTCFTPTARDSLSRSGFPCSFVPLDCPSWVGRFFGSLRPRALVLAETEIWPNLIGTALDMSIPCVSVNASLSGKSLRRLRVLSGSSTGRMLSCFSAILAKTGGDAARLRKLGVDPGLIRVAGDSKALCDSGDPPPGWRSYLPAGARILVAGSTREGEELPVVAAARDAGLFPVIAPRHLARLDEIVAELAGAGFATARWSAGPGSATGADCLLVDTMGLLARLYGLADVAFVGGTIAPFGGHNILEPLRRGVPVVVGESTDGIREVVDRGRAIGAVVSVPANGLEEAFRSVILSRPAAEEMKSLGNSEGRMVLESFKKAMRTAGVVRGRGPA